MERPVPLPGSQLPGAILDRANRYPLGLPPYVLRPDGSRPTRREEESAPPFDHAPLQLRLELIAEALGSQVAVEALSHGVGEGR